MDGTLRRLAVQRAGPYRRELSNVVGARPSGRAGHALQPRDPVGRSSGGTYALAGSPVRAPFKATQLTSVAAAATNIRHEMCMAAPPSLPTTMARAIQVHRMIPLHAAQV